MCTITGKYCKPLKSLSTGAGPAVFTQTKFPPLSYLNTTLFVVQVYRRQSEGRGEGERGVASAVVLRIWSELELKSGMTPGALPGNYCPSA